MTKFPNSTTSNSPFDIKRALKDNVSVNDPMTTDEKLDYLLSEITKFGRYLGYLTQSGTDAPVLNIELENTIGEITIERTNGGTYTFNSDGLFTVNKTIPIKENFTDDDGNQLELSWLSSSVLELKTYASTDLLSPADNILNNQLINIIVYK